MQERRAFTLIELLLVLAIVVVLAGVLFPVFSVAKSRAHAVQCMGQFRQVNRALALYVDDYDQTLVPINHRLNEPASSENDRTWVQTLLPYKPGFDQFFCPENHDGKSSIQGTFDQDLIPGDTSTRLYTASQKVNLGYNFQYLAPVIRQRNSWQAMPRSTGQISSLSNTLLFVDSAVLDASSGQVEGGSWLVVPPCRFEATTSGRTIDTFTGSVGEADIFTPAIGWSTNTAQTPFPFGGAWAWHGREITATMLDGSAKSFTASELLRGCDPLPNWQGLVRNAETYPWDLN
jgi:prepilin-type N-terminal cleavage/methylation domain-containing protein